MPSLDVSDAFDESFFDDALILRRTETVGTDGFATISATQKIPIMAVVTMASPDDLERLPEVDVSKKSITIVTIDRLQLESPGIKADIVQWAGDTFQVVMVEDYSRYGQGYIYAIATAINYLDPPPTPNPLIDEI